ncbi:cytokine-inducible SH2-containing protein-like [Myzus persicae]|uniref:cytokine-inducible SH2-containing protein-like n=1 Tax=Myzus persicae TaxID=13164 RepID=UPI000B9386EB|nr:cytokine-inducible SH2-containing protein-like [Myzus persicae]XP_022162876.1 cytokine-inducible SH2-containing protein-like [Myzus persicae]XP_022162877.1 cytokine-inducible SH2-containing protein-like [Myzus persicae]XP_022162878.1 cytokine-inducible SH2-containing protein-like [Myzus persicae]
MLNTHCWKTGRPDNGNNGSTEIPSPAAVLQDADKSMRLQACWIRLWDRWACEQRNVVLYQMHINHALSRERSKLTLAGGRVVSCRRIKQQQVGSGSRCCSTTTTAAAVSTLQQSVAVRSTAVHPTSRCIAYCTADDATIYNVITEASAASAASAIASDGGGARDLRVLSTAVARLRASGWYYEGAEAQALTTDALARMPAGRFCVRDSRHSEHLFTMDVQTGRCGEPRIMSVRFTYVDGVFGLDSMPRRAGALRVPKFRCPIELIDYYVRLSRIEAARQMLVYPVWIDQCGQFFSWMNLRRPVVKTTAAGFPSLKHMARLVINRHKRLITITPTSLPNELIEYLLQYPYNL